MHAPKARHPFLPPSLPLPISSHRSSCFLPFSPITHPEFSSAILSTALPNTEKYSLLYKYLAEEGLSLSHPLKKLVLLSVPQPPFTTLVKTAKPGREHMENPKQPSSLQVEFPVSEATHFKLPIDSEHKATLFRPFSFAAPHMRAFHLSWFSFFCCFVSTFATPPLLLVIRDSLGLTTTDIGNADIPSVSGVVFARLAMGTACDLVGPRLGSASLILLTTLAVYFTAIIDTASSYLLVRFFTGFSIASFISCQFWMSSVFSPPKVGVANGLTGGWGNLGSGATQLIMPLVYDLIRDTGATKSAPLVPHSCLCPWSRD